MELKKNPSKDIYRQSPMFFFLGLGISVALTICAFEWRSEKITPNPREYGSADNWVSVINIPVTDIQPKTPIQNHPAPGKGFQPSLQWSESKSESSEPNIDLSDLFKSNENPSGGSLEPEIDTTAIVVFPQQAPKPVGGYDSLYLFFSKQMKYPRAATRNEIQGRVFVEFVINKKGLPADVKILKGIGYGCDEEAARVIALTKWEPGKQRGIPVKVKMVLPVQFKIQ